MKYLIMIYHNAESQAVWERMPAARRAEGMRQYARLSEDLVAAGELVTSEALADPSQGRRVTVRDGQLTATDGPYAEVKEHLAGFFLVDVPDIERAMAYAARIPEAQHIAVEVRPILDLRSVGL